MSETHTLQHRPALGGRYCERCRGRTTHTARGCVVCLDRPDTRRVGLLWLAFGVPVVVMGVFFLAIMRDSAPTPMGDPQWLGAIIAGLGLVICWKGARKAVTGSPG